jgi:hypothetical protein
VAAFHYPPIGRCIYCGATSPTASKTKFGDEHIIPLALGGNLILREASCRSCETIINREIESHVLLREWIYLRVKKNFPTRGKSRNRPTHIKLTQRDGGPIKIPLQDYSTPVPAYKFVAPRILTGAPRGDDNACWTMDIYSDHDAEMQMQAKYPQWNGQHSIRAEPIRFARLLAKMAHSRAAAEYGLDGFTPLTVDVILGRSDDCFNVVGGTLDAQPAVPGGDHVLDLAVNFHAPNRAHLIVNVRLFSQMVSPLYCVVVGDIDFARPIHAENLERYRKAGKLARLA